MKNINRSGVATPSKFMVFFRSDYLKMYQLSSYSVEGGCINVGQRKCKNIHIINTVESAYTLRTARKQIAFYYFQEWPMMKMKTKKSTAGRPDTKKHGENS